jgi:hypothetical protein
MLGNLDGLPILSPNDAQQDADKKRKPGGFLF